VVHPGDAPFFTEITWTAPQTFGGVTVYPHPVPVLCSSPSATTECSSSIKMVQGKGILTAGHLDSYIQYAVYVTDIVNA
jgi:hypothetical protein